MLTIMMPMLMIHDADMMTTMMTSHDDDGEAMVMTHGVS